MNCRFSNRIKYEAVSSTRRKGSIIILIAGGMAVFLGCAALAVDYSFMVNDANRLQRACDAAALAGASELRATNDMTTNKKNARYIACKVFAENIRDDDSAAVFTPRASDATDPQYVTVDGSIVGTPSFDNDTTPTKVIVGGSVTRKYYFAKMGQGIVKRVASAVIRQGIGSNSATPIGISRETYAYWTQDQYKSSPPLVPLTLIRQNKQLFQQDMNDGSKLNLDNNGKITGSTKNGVTSTAVTGTPSDDPFVLFDLRDPNGKSGAHMLKQLTGEEPATSEKGDYETTLNAAQNSEQNKLEQGIEYRMQKASQSPWYDAWGGDWANANSAGTKFNDINKGIVDRSNPRVVNIVVAFEREGSDPKNGTFNTQVDKLVPVYIEKVTIDKEDKNDVIKMWVRFLTPVVGGATTTTSPDPSEQAEGGGYMISLDS